MFDDADFEALTPRGTARYTLRQVHIRRNPEPVVLVVKPATEANERYQNAVLKAPKAATSAEFMKQSASLFAKHVVTGWENVLGADGKPVAYTPEGGEELLHRLIDAKRADDIVAGLFIFARTPDNFTEGVVDAGDLGNG
jgi:hypothetical protein